MDDDVDTDELTPDNGLAAMWSELYSQRGWRDVVDVQLPEEENDA